MKKLLTLLAALFVTACVNKEAAQKELTVYTALEDEQIPVLLEKFNAQHPDIKVNIVRDSGGIITSRLLAEKANPQADVIWSIPVTSLIAIDKDNVLAGYNAKGADKINPKFKDGSKEPKWIANTAVFTTIVANKVELEKKGIALPTTLTDLTKPEYKGLITMPNPNSSGTGFFIVAGILQAMGEEKGWEFLDALHKNIGIYSHSGSKPGRDAAAGEYPIGLTYDYPAIFLKNNGSPIEVIFPKEGSGYDLEANALVNKPTIKEEAKIFVDWTISQEPMQVYAKTYGITAVKTDIPTPKGYPANPIDQLIDIDLQWISDNKQTILSDWSKRYNQ